MNELTDGRQGRSRPARALWWLTLLGLPVLDVASWVAVVGWVSELPWPAVALLTVLMNATILAAALRAVAATPERRVGWVVGGGVLAALVGAALAFVVVLALLSIYCQEGCFS